MENINLEDMEGRLAEIIDQAQIGDAVTITREGKPVAVITRIEELKPPTKRLDVDALKALTDSMTYHGTSAAELIREMRDSRY